MLVSLRVCKECQNTLLHAFNHCLSKQGNSTQSTAAADDGNYSSIGVAPAFTMDSIHQIDEVEDGKQLKEPPYLALVKDPTKPRNTIFLNSTDKVARDRATFADAKKSSSIATTTKSIDVPNLSLKSSSEAGVEKKKDFAAGKSAIDSGTVFSGTLYKRTLEAKAKEIQSLREKLYDKIASEQFEHENVERLRHALNKAVRFCAIAEEWHVDETSRLQYDVRCLKAEMSSLMAFLINSEEEKRRVKIDSAQKSPNFNIVLTSTQSNQAQCKHWRALKNYRGQGRQDSGNGHCIPRCKSETSSCLQGILEHD